MLSIQSCFFKAQIEYDIKDYQFYNEPCIRVYQGKAENRCEYVTYLTNPVNGKSHDIDDICKKKRKNYSRESLSKKALQIILFCFVTLI